MKQKLELIVLVGLNKSAKNYPMRIIVTLEKPCYSKPAWIKLTFKVPITPTQFLSFSKVDVESKPKQAK